MSHPLRSYLEIRSAGPTSFSSDGKRVLVSSNLIGTDQLYRVGVDGGALEALTAEPERVSGAYLPGRDDLLVSADSGGNERHQLYLLADAPGSALRPLVVEEDFLHLAGWASSDGRLLAYACNRRNGTDFDVYVRRLEENGDPSGSDDRCVFDRGGWCHAGGFSPDGRWLAILQLTERNGDNELYLVDLAGPPGSAPVRHVSSHDDEATFGAPAWLADSSGFYFATDTGRDVTALARYDLARGDFEYVLERPFELSCAVDRSGRHLLVTTNEDGYTRAELLDPATLAPLGEVPLPGRGAADFVFSSDGDRLAYQFTSACEPGDVWCYEIATGTTTRLDGLLRPRE